MLPKHGRSSVTFTVWSCAQDALMVPVAAAFRNGEDLAVFVARDGVARATVITIGQRNG